MRLHIVTPTKTSVHGNFIRCVQEVLVSSAVPATVTFEIFMGKSNIVHARSIMLSKWYDSSVDGDAMLFIDSDQTFSVRDVIKALTMMTDADLVCGIYCNSSGSPNAYMMDIEAFCDNARDDRVLYAGTGFMLIPRRTCTKLLPLVKELDGCERAVIDDEGVVPFFRTRLIDSENGLEPIYKKHWLGEDYSFCWLVRKAGGTIRGFISPTLGHEVMNIKYFVPNNYTGKTWDKGSIVYLCGRSSVKFDPTMKNLGGSEKAVVQLCKRWSAHASVTVFGNVTKGTYDGVKYRPIEEFNITDKFDTVILWRSYGCRYLPDIKANTIFIDLHDSRTLYPDLIGAKAHKIFLKSMFHKSLNNRLPDGKICVVPNGIEDEVLRATPDTNHREAHRFLYASSYDRGLEKILKYYWPRIRELLPTAELHCYYGMELFSTELRAHFEKLFEESTGVYDHGRVDLSSLIEEKKKASFHIYLTDDEAEIDCISVRESALLGCIPLLTREGVFKERIGQFFDVSMGYEHVAEQIVSLAKKEKKLNTLRKDIQESAKKSEPSWNEIANAWYKIKSSININA